MGGSQSNVDKRRHVRGGIFIQTQKTGFISRETISGVLHINLEEPFRGHLLQITLEGLEETHYSYTVSVGYGKQRRRKRIHVKGHNTLVYYSLPIYDFAPQYNNDQFILQPGQWSIPFQMVVADTLPSTMSYYKDHTRCNIVYKLHANIISKDANVRPVSGIQELFIGQQQQEFFGQLSQQSTCSPQVSCCCCCSPGQIMLEAATDKHCYGPSETVNITLNCDFTNYTKNVISLSIFLKGHITLKSNTSDRIHTEESFKLEKAVPVKSKKLQTTYQLVVPNNVPLTIKGNLVSLYYTVELKPQVDSCCCISNNTPLSLPIILNPTKNTLQFCNIPSQTQVQAPLNWKPVCLQQAQFNEQQAFYIQQQQQIFREQENSLYQLQMQHTYPDQSFTQPNMNNLNNPLI